MEINLGTVGRVVMVTATATFLMGAAVLDGGGVHAIGGLCNGRPASHTWLDASGQYGPAVLDGTKSDDVIVGSDGDDVIDGRGGNDTICGGRATTGSPSVPSGTPSSGETPATTT